MRSFVRGETKHAVADVSPLKMGLTTRTIIMSHSCHPGEVPWVTASVVVIEVAVAVLLASSLYAPAVI